MAGFLRSRKAISVFFSAAISTFLIIGGLNLYYVFAAGAFAYCVIQILVDILFELKRISDKLT